MRILVVSDIHANWAALSAITQPFDVCLCLGDLVDYGPDPAPCVRWAMTHATYAIRGNHDHGVAQGIPVSGANGFRYLTQVTRPSMWEALGPEERRYLLQLPVTQRVTLGGKRYLMVHATPRDPLDEYLLKDPQTWAKRLQNVDADVVCVGHTHIQFNIRGERRSRLEPRKRGAAARRRSARRLRDHRRQQDRDEAHRVSRRANDRPGRGDALAAAGQGDDGIRASLRSTARLISIEEEPRVRAGRRAGSRGRLRGPCGMSPNSEAASQERANRGQVFLGGGGIDQDDSVIGADRFRGRPARGGRRASRLLPATRRTAARATRRGWFR